jgi:hypothetical protein
VKQFASQSEDANATLPAPARDPGRLVRAVKEFVGHKEERRRSSLLFLALWLPNRNPAGQAG